MNQKCANDTIFYYFKDLDENLAWLNQKTYKESKCNKAILTFFPQTQ